MTTAAPSTALATIQPVFTDAERLALAGFRAGYRGLTREAYALDLRQFTTWCRSHSVNLLAVRRADSSIGLSANRLTWVADLSEPMFPGDGADTGHLRRSLARSARPVPGVRWCLPGSQDARSGSGRSRRARARCPLDRTQD